MSGAVRVVLAVLLAGGLLAAGLPAAERAATERAATRLDGAATTLADAAGRLAERHDPTRAGGARRTLRLRVPPDGRLRVGGNGTVAWRLDGGPWHRRRPPVALAPAGDGVRLGPGRHRVRLSLRRHAGRAVVNVRAGD